MVTKLTINSIINRSGEVKPTQQPLNPLLCLTLKKEVHSIRNSNKKVAYVAARPDGSRGKEVCLPKKINFINYIEIF